MINQSDQASNQYGFYAVPKALEPKKKYRETYQQENYYDDQQQEDDNLYETLQHQPENQRQLQRDYYVDEAPYPDFKPKQRGLDYGVQIQREDLFDFDMEVRPLVQILVGRSVVTAINQLQEEKQKNQRGENLDKYQKKRNAELMVTQRLQAQSKRKKQQSDRRKLQKQIYVKNKKQATKKIISRRNAKHCLLNMKDQVLQELEQDGYLRQQTYLTLRINYEGWLYEQIKNIIDDQLETKRQTQYMIREKEKEVKDEHKKAIQKQNQRRKQILDERARVKKQQEERKMKKKIRKERLQLNKDRAENADKAFEEVQKYSQVQKILKSENTGNGLTSRRNTPDTVQIAGGLFNFIVAYLNSAGNQLSSAQIQDIIIKILSQIENKLEIQISQEHFAKIEELKQKMQEDPIAFMKNKEQQINNLSEQISLDLSLLQKTRNSIRSSIHNGVISALLNISVNCIPQPKKEGEQIIDSYQATQKDKKREQMKQKVQITGQQNNLVQKIKGTQNVVRVRFQNMRPEQQGKQQKQKQQQEQQKKQVDLDEWIDIYDGNGWQHRLKQIEKQFQKQEQSATSYALTSFQNAMVVDERNLHYLEEEISKLLDIKAGEDFKNYKQGLNNVKTAEDNVPIYDVELQWE